LLAVRFPPRFARRRPVMPDVRRLVLLGRYIGRGEE
jgi:hypothetical protein